MHDFRSRIDNELSHTEARFAVSQPVIRGTSTWVASSNESLPWLLVLPPSFTSSRVWGEPLPALLCRLRSPCALNTMPEWSDLLSAMLWLGSGMWQLEPCMEEVSSGLTGVTNCCWPSVITNVLSGCRLVALFHSFANGSSVGSTCGVLGCRSNRVALRAAM